MKVKIKESTDPYEIIASMTGLESSNIIEYVADNNLDVNKITEDLIALRLKPKEIKQAINGSTNNRFSNMLKQKYSNKLKQESIKSKLKQIIKEEFYIALRKRRLKEAVRDSYTISYYATVGEHGEVGSKPDFKSAIKAALEFQRGKDSDNVSLMNGLEYLGVEPHGNAKDFAIIFATESYLKRIDNDQNFRTPEDRKVFVDALKKCIATGKPTKGSLNVNTTESKLSEANVGTNKILTQYLSTALWASQEDKQGHTLDFEYTLNDIASETVDQAKSDLANFLLKAKQFLPKGVDMSDIGHDFWLSRNHQGSGFFDAEYLDEKQQSQLQKLAQTFPERNAVLGDDGKIYFQ